MASSRPSGVAALGQEALDGRADFGAHVVAETESSVTSGGACAPGRGDAGEDVGPHPGDRGLFWETARFWSA